MPTVATLPELTERQERVLNFIMKYIDEHSCPPTIREIMDASRLCSPNGAVGFLVALERKGYISRSRNCARSLRVLVKPDGTPNNELETLRAENQRLREVLRQHDLTF